MKHYNVSILGDVDDQIEDGDKILDPFFILDVKRIHIFGNIKDLFFILKDTQLIFNETLEFVDRFNIIDNVKYDKNIFIDLQIKEIYVRFAWWICRELLYNQINLKTINIIQISQYCGEEQYLKVFVYKYLDCYSLSIELNNNTSIIIDFKNNSKLTECQNILQFLS